MIQEKIDKNRRICIKLIDVTHEEFAPLKKGLEKKYGLTMVSNKDTYWSEHHKGAYLELETIKTDFEKQDKIFLFTTVEVRTWKPTKQA